MLRLLSRALVALALLASPAFAQGFTLPELGLQSSGTCRQLAARDRTSNAMVPLGCLDTVARGWNLTPNTLNTSGSARFGSSLFAAVAAPVSTTATGANGGTTITVASAAGVKVGDTLYGVGVPTSCSTKGAAFQGVSVTAISGTTLTLSCPLTSALSNAPVTFGVQRNDPNATAMTNTLMAREGLFGSAAQGASTSWLNQVVAGYDYPATGAVKVVSSPGTPGGIVTATRASDATNGAATMGIACLIYVDAWAQTKSDGWCSYMQSNLAVATAGLTNHLQNESSVNSLWPATELDPFKLNAVNGTTNFRFDCGTGQATGSAGAPNTCSTALDFPANGATYKSINTVYNGAMDFSGGRVPSFASLPPGVALGTWYAAAGQRTWDIVSTATGGYGRLTFLNSEARFNANLGLEDAAGGGRAITWYRNGQPNIAMLQTQDAPGDLAWSRFDDSGNYIGLAMRIRRGDGKAYLTSLNLSGLPTGNGTPPAGLVSGDVWGDTSSNTLKFVP